MGMTLGDNLRVTLFGESHGACVGALVEGIPAGTEIDESELSDAILRRRPGRKKLSSRSESDDCEILSGVYDGKATGWPILLLTRNSDVRSSDYSFLPDHPRPGHADMVEGIRSNGANDPRGGGSQSGCSRKSGKDPSGRGRLDLLSPPAQSGGSAGETSLRARQKWSTGPVDGHGEAELP